MDKTKFNKIQKCLHDIEACDAILKANIYPDLNVEIRIDGVSATYVSISPDLWNKICKCVREQKQIYQEQFKSM